MTPLFVIAILIIAVNVFLVVRYRQGKITFLTDLLARMGGASTFIVYIWYQYTLRISLNIGFDSTLHKLSWINWFLIVVMFVFFIVAYLFRANPIVRAKGWHETLLPLFCAVAPISLLSTPTLHFLPSTWTRLLANTLPWQLAAFSLLVAGHALTLIGLLYLGKAFSIMVQARHVVQRGPYRYIRHPVYVGESIATIGVLLCFPNWINLVSVVVWLIAQWVRAHFEEEKLAKAFSSYSDYKYKTGSIFPKF